MAVNFKAVSKIDYFRRCAAFGFIRTHTSPNKIIPDVVFQLCVLFYGNPTFLERMDDALARFYDLKGIKGYCNDDGDGKFKVFCEENGLEDEEAIRDEIDDNIDPSECLLIDFDEDLFNDKGYDSEERAIEICKVLRECMNNKDAYMDPDLKYDALRVTKEDWMSLSSEDIEQVKKLYEKQCPVLFAGKFQSFETLPIVLAMGYKMGTSYLQYVADMYSRERIGYYVRNEILGLDQFVKTNLHMHELKNIKHQDICPSDAMEGALKVYVRHVTPVFSMVEYVIMDSLSEVSQWIAAIISFVHELATKAAPFQFDATFTLNQTPRDENPSHMRNDNDSDGDEHSDCEVSPDAFGNFFPDDEENVNYQCIDPFGDVKSKLADNKLLSVQREVTESHHDDYFAVLQEQFKKFKDEQINKKYKGDEAKNYPHKHRFCAFIDRRTPYNEEKKDKNITANDELIIYEPPNDCNTFPKEKHLPLFYFETARKCVIPSHDYKEYACDDTINTQSNLNGAIMILSFHVEEMNEIKCYICMRDFITRFLPCDIINLLPKFFDPKFGDNARFVKSSTAKKLVDEMNQNLKGMFMSCAFPKIECSRLMSYIYI